MRKLILIGALITSTPALAYSQMNLTVSAVGSQSDGTSDIGYFQTTTPTTAGCNGTIYINLSTEAGRAMLSVALSARLANRSLARVDYNASGSTCFATLLQI